MPSARMPALPAGFRFHPTDEELIVHYLTNQAASMACPAPIIAEVNIYRCNPWDLPAKALFGENEWYFFSPRERKYPNGARPNRAAGSGYWKATGTDKAILSTPTSENIGVRKQLVFYRGKPPKGVKTDWTMHEYRLLTAAATATASKHHRRGSSMRLDDWVLCRIYKKSNDFQRSSSDEQEQEEGSTVEEGSPNVNGTSPKPEAPAGDAQLRPLTTISKPCSLTDLLNTMDCSSLSQLLLDGSSDAPLEPLPSPPITYAAPPCQTLHHESSVNNHIDSRISSFGGYCNQQLADQGGFEYSSLLSHPFPLNQQLLLNSHLQMQ